MRLIIGFLALALTGSLASAQTVDRARVVASCGTPPITYTAGEDRNILQDTTGRVCSTTTSTLTGTSVDAMNASLDDIEAAVESTNPVQTYVSNSYARISTNTTTVVKSGAGTLTSITINTKGASANTATVYDNTSAAGTVIAVIDTTTAPMTLSYNVAVGTGITIVTATGTAADLTVSYR